MLHQIRQRFGMEIQVCSNEVPGVKNYHALREQSFI